MSSSTLQSSVRSQGRDTLVTKCTKFLDVDAIQRDANGPTEPKYELWTDEHSASSKNRRENRENRVKPPPVAEVPDFDLETHLKTRDSKEKSKWKLW